MSKVVMAGSLSDKENVLMHLRDTCVLTAKDVGNDKFDAWMYGIIVGWDKESIKELAPKFGWSEDTIKLMKKLNKEYNKLLKKSVLKKAKKNGENIKNVKKDINELLAPLEPLEFD